MKKANKHGGPLYKMVKEYVLNHINSEGWKPGERIQSENELVRDLGVSRMTVNRALRELADGGFLVRVAGVGTFVAEKKSRGHLFAIRNIADEIRERGHHHSATIVRLEQVRVPTNVSRLLELPSGTLVFNSVIVHKENDSPVQVEDRYVNPVCAPDYLSMDFSEMTPSEYLLQVSPLQEVEHIVRAVNPTKRIARFLEMNVNQPCLLLQRRTWSIGLVASFARLHHPAFRYTLGDRFVPKPFRIVA